MVKKADKYVTEAYRQLDNDEFYQSLTFNPSGNESLPEPISKYIDYFIKPFLTSLPVYLQDTTDGLNKIKELNNIGTASFLVPMDVESLSIHHH